MVVGDVLCVRVEGMFISRGVWRSSIFVDIISDAPAQRVAPELDSEVEAPERVRMNLPCCAFRLVLVQEANVI